MGDCFSIIQIQSAPFLWLASIPPAAIWRSDCEQCAYLPKCLYLLPWKLTLGEEASIGEWALIYNLGPVSIGNQATISHRAHLCAGTHDYRDPTLPLLRSSIDIGAQAWICADAFIGPNTSVGEGAIVGAASVITKEVGPWQIVAGNPPRFIKMRTMKDEFHDQD